MWLLLYTLYLFVTFFQELKLLVDMCLLKLLQILTDNNEWVSGDFNFKNTENVYN